MRDLVDIELIFLNNFFKRIKQTLKLNNVVIDLSLYESLELDKKEVE